MAVQQITSKRIIKHDTSNPNYKPEPIKENVEPVVNGNSVENKENGVFQGDNVYGEKMEHMMSTMIGKLDKLKVNSNGNLYGESNDAVEVDVKRNVFLAKPDEAEVSIDKVQKGKVNNKVNKLRALRKRNGR